MAAELTGMAVAKALRPAVHRSDTGWAGRIAGWTSPFSSTG